MCTVAPPPFSRVQPVVDILHGVPVADPYRWLEDQNSPETRAWIEEQTRYARGYLDNIPGRDRIRERVCELLDVETYDSFLKNRTRYFFRKRLPGQEQPSIYFRDGADGEDQLLIDPANRCTGAYTAVKPLRVSPDGSLLLYEVKHGGERMGRFELLDVAKRKALPDALPHGYLRGFAFAPDGRSFYYVHEAAESNCPFCRAAFLHTLGTSFAADQKIFSAGEDEKLRLALVASRRTLGFLVYRFLDKACTDFYICGMGSSGSPVTVLRDADYSFAPRLLPGRILALIDRDAPNRRIVDVQARRTEEPLFFDLVPESEATIRKWVVTATHIFVVCMRTGSTRIDVYDLFGKRVNEIQCDTDETLRLLAEDPTDDSVLIERESFTRPSQIHCYSATSRRTAAWPRRVIPFDSSLYAHAEESFPSRDGTQTPVFLVGRPDALSGGPHPTVMTSYGGFGVPTTPQFSVLIACLIERGCLVALPRIRGGSEFGAEWHNAAKRRNRHVAFDDFLDAAQWLIKTGRTIPSRLAIFGGSNSGLLVAAALTQEPSLFRAVLCMVPITDMLRYHRFDSADAWKAEFGTVDDPEDFAALHQYSPYHQIRDGVAYPSTLVVSGDSDQTCNPLHARKFAARLQAASPPNRPILLDYDPFRGHAPVLPLSKRIAALTDRLAFLFDQLGISEGAR